MEPNKHSIGSIIAGILFLIVFIGGMIGIYIGTTDDIRISIISLGAILLAVGIAAISSAVKQKGSKKVLPVTISLVFVLIGAGLITLPLLNMLTGFEIGGEIIIYASLGLFVVIGLLLILIPIAKMVYMKRVCTCVVEAKCVGLEKVLSVTTTADAAHIIPCGNTPLTVFRIMSRKAWHAILGFPRRGITVSFTSIPMCRRNFTRRHRP